jgi:glycosyltransferase involved in cell wall biosynthesis
LLEAGGRKEIIKSEQLSLFLSQFLRAPKLLQNTSHNILIVTYWAFDDALVQTYTIPYLRIIKKILPANSIIYLVTQEPNLEKLDQLNTHSDPDFQLLPMVYTPFGGRAILKLKKMVSFLTKFIDQNNIKTIHAWCTPAGAIAYLLHKKTKVRLVIDSFEPHAESMVENGTWESNSMAFKILWKLEKKQARSASHLIGLTNGMRQYCLEKYGVTPRQFHVKPACVDSLLYGKSVHQDIRQSLGINKEDTVCVYAGKIGGIYYEDEVFLFWKACIQVIPNFKVLFLTNFTPEETELMCAKHGLDPKIIIQKFVPHNEIPELLAQADFALNPVKPVPSKKYCTSIKDGEYWSSGLPVVITPNISEDSDIIEQNKIGVILKSTEYEDLLNSAKEIKSLLLKPELSDKIKEMANHYRSFEIANKVYAKIYSNPEKVPC